MLEKDYIKLARVIKDCTNQAMEPAFIEREPFLEQLSDILKEDNPRFDKERFIEACK